MIIEKILFKFGYIKVLNLNRSIQINDRFYFNDLGFSQKYKGYNEWGR